MSRLATRSIAAAIAVLTATTVVASADEVDRRQYNQQRRIEAGVRDGSITRQEYVRLQQEQARIADFERRAKADGRLDRSEAAILDHAQDNASRSIRAERHDVEGRHTRHGFWRRWW
jgi:hypothetical protein